MSADKKSDRPHDRRKDKRGGPHGHNGDNGHKPHDPPYYDPDYDHPREYEHEAPENPRYPDPRIYGRYASKRPPRYVPHPFEHAYFKRKPSTIGVQTAARRAGPAVGARSRIGGCRDRMGPRSTRLVAAGPLLRLVPRWLGWTSRGCR